MIFQRLGNYDGIELYGTATLRGNYVIAFEGNHCEASYKPHKEATKEMIFQGNKFSQAEKACRQHYKRLAQ